MLSSETGIENFELGEYSRKPMKNNFAESFRQKKNRNNIHEYSLEV